MRTPILALSLLLVAAAFSGCIADEADPDETNTDTGTDAGGLDANNTTDPSDGDGAPEPNAPPVATLGVSNTSGDVPITVTFTLSGSDPDGLFFQWTLDANGDGAVDEEGESLPAEVNYTFEVAGNYTAVFNLSDGEDTTEDTMDLTFTSPPPQPIPEPIVFEGTISGTTVTEEESVFLRFNHTVPVSAVNISMEMGDESIDIDWYLLDPSGAEADSSAAENVPIVAKNEGNLSIPEDKLDVYGEWTIELSPFLIPVPTSYKVTVEFLE